jgi:hypothetical protein
VLSLQLAHDMQRVDCVRNSVADPGCFIPDPDPTIAPSQIRIPDPGGKKAPDPGSDLFFIKALTNFVCLSRIRIRPLLHPGSGGVKKHRIRIRNTGTKDRKSFFMLVYGYLVGTGYRYRVF